MAIFYFSYGSNMSEARFAARIGTYRRLGRGRLEGHDLRFHKVGRKDGSGKCDAYETGDDRDFVLGVVYEIPAHEKAELDRIEGLGQGYEEKRVSIEHEGEVVEAVTYFATSIADGLLPFDWYLTHVLKGAEEAGFPAEYLARLENTPKASDPDEVRARRELSIHRNL